MKQSSYLLQLSAIYTVCLVISNIASNKLVDFFGFNIDGGFIFFPLTYVLNDIITEVYGFKTARKVIWTALFANIFTVCGLYLVINLPSSHEWHHQQAFEQVFDLSARIFFASLTSYIIGEMINSIMLAKMKVLTHGLYMPFRFIASTIVGAALENSLFYFIAFYGVFDTSLILEMMTVQYILKVLYEIAILPVSCPLANYLKRKENIDYYDDKTKFSIVKFS